jgi:hypothetical protein
METLTPQELPLLLGLVLVHLVADFFMQTNTWVTEKNTRHYRSKFVYLHSTIHGLLSWLLLWAALGDLRLSLNMAAVIGLSHALFDIGKSYTPGGRYSWFILDQILHLSVILLVWLYLTDQWPLLQLAWSWSISPKPLIVLIAYITVMRPCSFMIAIIIGKWSREIDNSGSLAEAGARIGLIERFLILTFILVDQFSAIGFLLAAKSVLRFGDLRENHHRKLTEYVLLGTMISFALTISLGLMTRGVLSLV